MILKTTPFLAAGLVAVALIAPATAQETGEAPAAEKLEFRLKLAKGDAFAFRQKMNMNQDLDMGGMQVSTVIDMTSDYAYEVLDVAENGDMSIKIRFGRIHGSFENPMFGALEFDSEKETEETGNPMIDMMGSMFTANAGQELTLKLDEDGDVLAVEGVEELVDRILENNPMAGMGGQMDPETMKQSMKDNFEGQLGMIPPDPIAVGESWTTDRGMSAMAGMGMQLSVTSTLKSLSDDEAVVDSTIKGELTGGQMAAMMTVEDFSGTSSTTISVKDGLPLSSKADMTMTATMDAGPQGQGAMSMTVTTTLERIPVTSSAKAPAPVEQPAEQPAETPSDE